jgi:hypothetical protein
MQSTQDAALWELKVLLAASLAAAGTFIYAFSLSLS